MMVEGHNIFYKLRSDQYHGARSRCPPLPYVRPILEDFLDQMTTSHSLLWALQTRFGQLAVARASCWLSKCALWVSICIEKA
jgi:hypothetical protein